jgi:hypothetical protein
VVSHRARGSTDSSKPIRSGAQVSVAEAEPSRIGRRPRSDRVDLEDSRAVFVRVVLRSASMRMPLECRPERLIELPSRLEVGRSKDQRIQTEHTMSLAPR